MGSLISRHSHSQHAQNGNESYLLNNPEVGVSEDGCDVLTHPNPQLLRRYDGSILRAIKKLLWARTPMWARKLAPVEWLTFRAMSLQEPSDKVKMHQSYPIINLNLALIAPLVVPHLSVLDAYDAMEGDGPTQGEPVPLRLALASTDALAADVVGTALMGFAVDEIGYLSYCKRMGLGNGDLSQIDVVGNATVSDCARQFRPHHSYHRQRRWRLPDADRYLSRALVEVP